MKYFVWTQTIEQTQKAELKPQGLSLFYYKRSDLAVIYVGGVIFWKYLLSFYIWFKFL